MTTSLKTGDSQTSAGRAAAAAVAVGVVLLVLIGFAASYVTLRDLAVSAGRFSAWLAPVVPLSFDLGIVVLSLKVVLAAKYGRRCVWLRLLVAGLSACTVAANASAAPTLIGRLLHAVPSAMFVICFESVTGSTRRGALCARGAAVSVPPIHPLLLMLAPFVTARSWRRELLKELRRTSVSPTPADAVNPAQLSGRRVAAAPAGRSTEMVTANKRSPRVGASIGDDSARGRLRCAQAVLRANPEATAATLANVLEERGHPCSVRTAQRVKAQVLAMLTAGETDSTDQDAA